jgi:hypothetical protein
MEMMDEPILLFEDMIYKTTKEEQKKCKDFVKACYPTNRDCYAKRGQDNKIKVMSDNLVGKLAEIAVWRLFGTEEPDFKIYADSRKKSFDADLRRKDIDIHVKCQTASQAKRTGLSWTFQKQDNPDPDSVIVGCQFFTGGIIQVHAAIRVSTVNEEGLWGQPRKYDLRDKKKMLYYKDIDELKTQWYGEELEEFKRELEG